MFDSQPFITGLDQLMAIQPPARAEFVRTDGWPETACPNAARIGSRSWPKPTRAPCHIKSRPQDSLDLGVRGSYRWRNRETGRIELETLPLAARARVPTRSLCVDTDPAAGKSRTVVLAGSNSATEASRYGPRNRKRPPEALPNGVAATGGPNSGREVA